MKPNSIKSFFQVVPQCKKLKISHDSISVSVSQLNMISTMTKSSQLNMISTTTKTFQGDGDISQSETTVSSVSLDLVTDMNMEGSWRAILQEEFNKSYFLKLVPFLESEMISNQIFPPKQEVFQSFKLCPYNEVKVVIIGQDPYHGPGQVKNCFNI